MAGSERFVLARCTDGMCAVQRHWWGLRWCGVISAEGSSTSSPGRAQYQKEVKRDYCKCLVIRVLATKHLYNICINHPVMSIALVVMVQWAEPVWTFKQAGWSPVPFLIFTPSPSRPLGPHQVRRGSGWNLPLWNETPVQEQVTSWGVFYFVGCAEFLNRDLACRPQPLM